MFASRGERVYWVGEVRCISDHLGRAVLRGHTEHTRSSPTRPPSPPPPSPHTPLPWWAFGQRQQTMRTYLPVTALLSSVHVQGGHRQWLGEQCSSPCMAMTIGCVTAICTAGCCAACAEMGSLGLLRWVVGARRVATCHDGKPERRVGQGCGGALLLWLLTLALPHLLCRPWLPVQHLCTKERYDGRALQAEEGSACCGEHGHRK